MDVVSLIVLFTGVCAIMIFALTGVATVAGFVIFGVIYGFSAGACMFPYLLFMFSNY